MLLNQYTTEKYFDELIEGSGEPRPQAVPLIKRLAELNATEPTQRQHAAELALFESGTTFNVYGDELSTERIIPFDVVPRIIDASMNDCFFQLDHAPDAARAACYESAQQ